MSNYAMVDGLRVRYLCEGSGSKEVVFLHGYSFNIDTWLEINAIDSTSKLAKVWAFDMPYGIKSRSDKIYATDRSVYAKFLARLLSVFNIRRPVLVGASIGGKVVLRFLASGGEALGAVVIGPTGLGDRSLLESLKRVKAPILGIWGSEDRISPISNAERLREVTGARIAILDGAGHPAYLDRPREFKAILLEFLASLG